MWIKPVLAWVLLVCALGCCMWLIVVFATLPYYNHESWNVILCHIRHYCHCVVPSLLGMLFDFLNLQRSLFLCCVVAPMCSDQLYCRFCGFPFLGPVSRGRPPAAGQWTTCPDGDDCSFRSRATDKSVEAQSQRRMRRLCTVPARRNKHGFCSVCFQCGASAAGGGAYANDASGPTILSQRS